MFNSSINVLERKKLTGIPFPSRHSTNSIFHYRSPLIGTPPGRDLAGNISCRAKASFITEKFSFLSKFPKSASLVNIHFSIRQHTCRGFKSCLFITAKPIIILWILSNIAEGTRNHFLDHKVCTKLDRGKNWKLSREIFSSSTKEEEVLVKSVFKPEKHIQCPGPFSVFSGIFGKNWAKWSLIGNTTFRVSPEFCLHFTQSLYDSSRNYGCFSAFPPVQSVNGQF